MYHLYLQVYQGRSNLNPTWLKAGQNIQKITTWKKAERREQWCASIYCILWRKLAISWEKNDGEGHYLQEHRVTGQMGIALNWKRSGFDWLVGRNFLLEGQWGSGRCCPERLWMSHHWMAPWATWTNGRSPCPWSPEQPGLMEGAPHMDRDWNEG